MRKIKRILVVEDSRMFREFLVSWLRGSGYKEVLEAESLAEAKAQSLGEKVDLVLLDLDLPDGDGLEYLDWVSRGRRGTRVLVLTAHSECYPVVKLKRSVVMGVLDKGQTGGTELRAALEAVEEWRTYYTERVERRFRDVVREASAFYKTLSVREEELIKLFGMGLKNGQIADLLELSESTIQGHRRNVMAKLGVKSTPQLMMWAIRNGFVRSEEIVRGEPWTRLQNLASCPMN